MKLLKAIRDFSKGFVDSFGRGKEPEGSFADSRNLIPTKIGSLETVHGYAVANISSHVSSTTALPTAFPDVTGTGTYNIVKVVADPFCYASENPISYDARVFWVENDDETAVKHIMLDSWFRGATMDPTSGSAARLTTPNNGFVMLDERKTIAYSADVTMASPTDYKITITSADAKGLSASNDYYNGWRLEWDDSSEGTTKYAYVTDYGYSGTTATFTLLEDISSGNCEWNLYGSGDTLTLRRWFHSHTSFVPAFATPPGKTWESQGIVRGCGGGASTTYYDPWWCGYINRTFFNGVTGGAITYQGTYVDLMETSPITAGEKVDITSAGGLTVDGTGAKALTTVATYGIAYTLEYDGYQESPLYGQATTAGDVNGTTNYVTFTIGVHFAALSKRVTAINIYANQEISGVTSDYYHIRRVALHTIPTAEQSMWVYGDSTGHGFFAVDGPGTVTSTIAHLTGEDWDNRGQTYFDRTGRNENSIASVSKNIVNWQYSEVVAGRRFFGYFYDPTAVETITDYVRFTPYGLGVPDFDIIPNDRLNYEFEVSSGDPGAIKGLISDKGFLYTFKDDSILSTYVNADPETWVHSIVSNQDGLYSAKSLVKTPDGGICFADADNFKILWNQRVIPITTHWQTTYYSLAGKASIISWYDKIDGAVCFTNGVDSTAYTHYRGYKTSDGYAWYKIVLPATNYPEFVGTERDESVIFTNQYATFPGLFKWAKTSYAFGSGAIIPYLKTNNIVLDESAYALLDKIVFTKSGNGSAGTLQTRVYYDDSITQAFAVSQSFTSEDKTMKTLYQKLKATSVRQSRRFYIEYNYHTTGESCSTAKMQLDGIDIYGVLLVPPEKSV